MKQAIILLPFLFVVGNFFKISLGYFGQTLSMTSANFIELTLYLVVFFLSKHKIKNEILTKLLSIFLVIFFISYLLNIGFSQFGINIISYDFTFFSSFYIFLIPFLVCININNHNFNSYYKLFLKALFYVLILDIVVSIIQIYLFYVIKLPYSIVYFNPVLNSIILSSTDTLRIFGIFTSGGANGFFLLFSFIVLIHNYKKLEYSKFLIMMTVLIITVLIVFTFTRKIYLIFGISIILSLFYYYKYKVKIKNKSIVFILLFIFLLLVMLLILAFTLFYFSNLKILDPSSLFIRFEAWFYFLNFFITREFWQILFGLSLTQSGLELIPFSLDYDYIDNMFLSILLYTGLVGLVMYFYIIFSLVNVYKKNIIGSEAIVLLTAFFIHGLFATTWASYDVAIYFYPYLIILYKKIKFL